MVSRRTQSDLYVVQIINRDTDKVVKQLPPTSLQQCQRLEASENIKLKHSEFKINIKKCEL